MANGATMLRWGFGMSAAGPNALAKYKVHKTNKPQLLFCKVCNRLDAENRPQAPPCSRRSDYTDRCLPGVASASRLSVRPSHS